MSIWPSAVQLRVEPRFLRAAVDALAATEEEVRIPADRLAELQHKLRGAADPMRLRLVSRELRALGVLVAVANPADLPWRRVLRDVLFGNIDRLPASVVASAIAAGWRDPALDGALLQRAAACNGVAPWLGVLVEARPSPSEFVPRLAQALIQRGAGLGDLAGAWRVPRGSPLHLQLGTTMLGQWTLARRNALWSTHATFVKDANEPIDLRRAALASRFADLHGARFTGELQTRTPIGQWLELAHDLCEGWPVDRQTAWALLPPEASELARQYVTLLAIDGFFERVTGNEDRKQYWRRRVKQIRSFVEFKKANAFALQLGPRYIVEFLDVGNACYAYDEAQFAQIRAYNPSHPSGLKLKSVRGTAHWLSHHAGWEANFDRYLREYCGVPRP